MAIINSQLFNSKFDFVDLVMNVANPRKGDFLHTKELLREK